jgi:GTPase SAR1 family protein
MKVGKSATTIQLCNSQFIEVYDPTIGKYTRKNESLSLTHRFFWLNSFFISIEDSYRHTMTVDDQTVTLEIQDTAGQEGFMTLIDRVINYFPLFCLFSFYLVYPLRSPTYIRFSFLFFFFSVVTLGKWIYCHL